MNYIVYLTVFSIICNLAVIGLLLLKGLKVKFEQKLLIFNLVLLIWQIGELLLRIPASLEFIYKFDLYASSCYLFIGYFLLEVVYESKLIVLNRMYLIRVLIFAVSLFFLISYLSFPEPRLFVTSEYFGLVQGFRAGSLDIYSRVWIGICVMIALAIIARSLYAEVVNFNKIRLFFIALLVPSIYGLVFQIIFPIYLGYEVPGATVLLSVFSIVSLIVFKDNFIFYNYSDESVYGLFNKVNSIMFVYDGNGIIHFSNNLFSEYFQNCSSIFDLKEGAVFLEKVSGFGSDKELSSGSGRTKEVLITEEQIGSERFQYMCYPIYNESKIEGGMVIGVNVTKYYQIRNSILNSFDNFKRINAVPNSFFIEINSKEKQVILNDRILSKFTVFQSRSYGYFQFFLLLRKYVESDQLLELFTFFKGNSGNLLENRSKKLILEVNNFKFFYVFEISFKKMDFQLMPYSDYIYLTDITESKISKIANEWSDKSTSWIISHIFRKPIANILGLMNLIQNEKHIYDSRLSNREIFTLIDSEVNELDDKMKVYLNNSLKNCD
ncbi:hypothetical protein SAMN04489724_2254 [Algoriphagus locisalis]|uniref:Uncharacterized protein n=1 Tax=Algoriphagus locisalis TaxID=305507 RepID=A0A1I7BAJ7_9BACT|nr:hypothetical protein [Algoriphagus locisalis]SFT84239.1 hypothetical protein SAMN04489724_2254 [Algoriphagus locisalis]